MLRLSANHDSAKIHSLNEELESSNREVTQSHDLNNAAGLRAALPFDFDCFPAQVSNLRLRLEHVERELTEAQSQVRKALKVSQAFGDDVHGELRRTAQACAQVGTMRVS